MQMRGDAHRDGSSQTQNLQRAQTAADIPLAEASGIWAFAVCWFVKNSKMTRVGRVMKARNTPLRPRTEGDFADKL